MIRAIKVRRGAFSEAECNRLGDFFKTPIVQVNSMEDLIPVRDDDELLAQIRDHVKSIDATLKDVVTNRACFSISTR